MIISEKELNKVQQKENNEPLLNISEFDSRIKVLIPEYMKCYGFNNILVRKTIAKKLSRIQSELKPNMNLVITSGFRPIEIQRRIYDSFYKKNKRDYPKWLDEKIREETRKIIAPPDAIPPHSTGAAIDLTIYKDNKPLDMGCEIPMIIDVKNPDIPKFPTNSRNITKIQKENRRYLSRLMKKYDFVNLESEWWHWSYGDKYWAAKKGKTNSIYSSIK
jgi:zinc D-Ala-D-Ala dipeptidase